MAGDHVVGAQDLRTSATELIHPGKPSGRRLTVDYPVDAASTFRLFEAALSLEALGAANRLTEIGEAPGWLSPEL